MQRVRETQRCKTGAPTVRRLHRSSTLDTGAKLQLAVEPRISQQRYSSTEHSPSRAPSVHLDLSQAPLGTVDEQTNSITWERPGRMKACCMSQWTAARTAGGLLLTRQHVESSIEHQAGQACDTGLPHAHARKNCTKQNYCTTRNPPRHGPVQLEFRAVTCHTVTYTGTSQLLVIRRNLVIRRFNKEDHPSELQRRTDS